MQDSGCIPKKSQLSAERKRTILQQLADMFSCPPNEQLQSLCESRAWNVERCIDYLISENSHERNENQRKFQSGAIPKQTTVSMGEKSPMKGAFQKKSTPNGYNYGINNKKPNFTTGSSYVEQRITKLISNGSKIMVLMRGPPGCGKSYLAKALVERYVPLNDLYTLKDFIFSADDFFYNNSGEYKWQGCLLEKAHEFNHRRVSERMQAGWSPIFVDNTNIKLWEMMPYVKMAVENGYVIELLEPKTIWRNSARKLSLKTKHGVPADKIQHILDNYEKGTVGDLMKMLKTTKYKDTIPQIRSHPPISFGQQDAETEEIFQIYQPENCRLENNLNVSEKVVSESLSVPTDANKPKAQRESARSKQESTSTVIIPQSAPLAETNMDLNIEQLKDTNSWQRHEDEVNKFWDIKPPNSDKQEPPLENYYQEKSLQDLLREGVSDEKSREKNDENPQRPATIERHIINCPNENKSFASLRQIYPNKELASLWDLFVKCDGNIDWAIDILLREDELKSGSGSLYVDPLCETVDDFLCNCDAQKSLEKDNTTSAIPPTPISTSLVAGTKPQRQRTRAARNNQRSNPELQEITEIIANRFVLDEEQYSPHIRKLREVREKLRNPTDKSYVSTEVQTEVLAAEEETVDDDVDIDGKEIIEVTLGDDLVQQLKNIFQAEMTTLVERLPDNPVLKVFMPRSLAKELYMLWVESVYNQLEEQRQKIMREDAHFARLLKNPKYENYSQSPGNIQELLDMELAWQIYNDDQQGEMHRSTKIYQPTDLAAHLTQLKLCENYPNIPSETLIDILSAHDNNYDETVKVLSDTMYPAEDNTVAHLQKKLLQCTLQEQEMLKMEQQDNNRNSSGMGVSDDRVSRVPLQPEEEKRMALHDFEEMRNLAAHHCQLKAECYQKAKDAIQKGNSAVAVYYSQIANLHKMRLDMYNHRAANCIMDVHKYTQNNPELLDLHYLHVLEAIGCLDLFLDRHITGIRAASRSYKHVFIITGRGLHSAGGVSTIKNKVKSRLKERNLRWSEVNPGLLKVKIFSASRHSKNI